MKTLRVVAALLLIAGLSLTARAGYLRAKAALAGVLIHRAWEQGAANGESPAPWPWADTHPVARLRIPRLGYDEIVLEGATPRTLAFGPARLRSSAAPGEPGNLVLAGHRASWFRRLESLAAGDAIEVEWFDATQRRLRRRGYTVDSIRVVTPDEVSLLAPTAQDALTLITCYPFGRGPTSPLRYIVRATPVGTRRS
jgi:sortase A